MYDRVAEWSTRRWRYVDLSTILHAVSETGSIAIPKHRAQRDGRMRSAGARGKMETPNRQHSLARRESRWRLDKVFRREDRDRPSWEHLRFCVEPEATEPRQASSRKKAVIHDRQPQEGGNNHGRYRCVPRESQRGSKVPEGRRRTKGGAMKSLKATSPPRCHKRACQ